MKFEKESRIISHNRKTDLDRNLSNYLRNRSKAIRYSLRALILFGVFFFQSTGILAQSTSPMWVNPIDLTQASSSTNAIDPIILCDKYQNTHILWGDRGEMPALYYMNDASGEWSAPIDVIANTDNSALIMRLSAAIQKDPDNLHVLWIDEYIGGGLNYSQVHLDDASNPRTWMNPTPLAIGVENGILVVDEDGTLHVVYGVSGTDLTEVLVNYIFSNDDGDSWSPPVRIFSKKVPFPSNTITTLDLDSNGRLHVGISIRSQDYGKYSEIGYMRSIDGGISWGEYLLIDDIGTAYQGVNLITPYSFEGDEVHLTWHDPRRMHQWSNDGGETWNEPVEIMSLGAAFGGSNELTKDSKGTMYVVTAENGGVFSSYWERPRWGVPERIENRSFDPHGQRITICQGNKLQVVYDDRSDSQKIWYSYRTVDAPRLDRQPINFPDPAMEESNSSTPSIYATPKTTDESSPTSNGPIEIPDNADQLPANQLTPMLIASGLVIAMILVIVLLKRR